MKGDDEKCLAAGCDDYISKPIQHEKLLQTLNKYLSKADEDICNKVDSVKSEVEQLNQLCSETSSSDNTSTKPANEQHNDCPVNFSIIQKIYDNEEVLKETVTIFLEEAPQTMKLLSEAVEAEDPNNIKIHAHKLKGLTRHVAARKLTDILFELETKGRKAELNGSKELCAEVQKELDKLMLFLYDPNWYQTAELQSVGKKI
jgi:HPt (histidine-containing phosphotransfer) domain-containing protein